MFPWFEVYRSANEDPTGDSEALGGSIKATPSAPEPAQGTQENEDRKAVPYERFKAVNDKLADALARAEMGEAPDPNEPQVPTLSPEVMKDMMKEALGDLGLSSLADEAKQLRIERKRDHLMGELRKFDGFDETRDLPRIQAKMQEAKVGAVNAFKLLMFDAPNPQAPVAHDVPGKTTGRDVQDKQLGRGNMSENQKRELAAKATFKKMLEGNPAFKKALEL